MSESVAEDVIANLRAKVAELEAERVRLSKGKAYQHSKRNKAEGRNQSLQIAIARVVKRMEEQYGDIKNLARLYEQVKAEREPYRAALQKFVDYRFACSDTPGATEKLDRMLNEATDAAVAVLNGAGAAHRGQSEENPHPGGYCTLGESRCRWCREQAARDKEAGR